MDVCIICKTNNTREIIRNGLFMFECKICGLFWRNKFDNDIVHYEDLGIKISSDKLNARIRNANDRINFIEKYIKPNNLCDIGAGEGVFVSELKKRGYQNIIGIEPNKKAVFFARSHGINVSEGSINNILNIVKNNNIHILTLFHVIEHLNDPLGTLISIYESLGKGDHLVIETPNAKAYSILKVNYQHPLFYPEHLFYFNTKNLISLLKMAGFSIKVKGKRSFDQYNMDIRQSLFRLGIGKPPFKLFKKNSCENVSIAKKYSKRNLIIRMIIRKTFNLAVIILRRVDYQCVIAQK